MQCVERSLVIVELSHVVTDGTLTYPGLPAPRFFDHMTFIESRAHYAPGTEFRISGVEMVGNTGTYLDSPAHRHRDGVDAAGLPLERCVDLPGVVVRCESTGPVKPERLRGLILAGRAVLFHTGHDARWGGDGYSESHPFLAADTVDRLLESGPALVGIDSLNIDDTSGGERIAHTALLGAGIPIVEHLTGLDRLPDEGFRFNAAPLPLVGLVTSPVRAYAVVNP